MTTFFSVDVETSDTRIGLGVLLTIGVQPVRWTPTTGPVMLPDRFYVRVGLALPQGWLTPPSDDRPHFSDTHVWWWEQSEEARDEAFANRSLLRFEDDTAARMLAEFAATHEDDPAERIFVANPVAFDKPWIDLLFAKGHVENPFHYRSLCLRSMKFGMRPGSAWGNDRETHDPKIPHHAYWDAEAQARDLIAMLTERDEKEGS